MTTLPAPRLVFPLALVVVWSGMALRLWAILTLGRFFRTTVVVQEDHVLVQSGPYGMLRNPAYTGALITLAGFGAAIGNWISVALLTAVPLVGYVRRIRVEERALSARFGPTYLAYRKRTWALFPLLW